MKHSIVYRFYAAVLLVALGLPVAAAFWNLTGDLAIHDPSIIKEDFNWYTFGTGPGIQLLQGDMTGLAWQREPQIFSAPLAWWKTFVPKQANNDVWAPDVQRYNNKVWLYYAISTFGSNTSAIGLASANKISDRKWTDQGLVIRSTTSDNFNAIDPNLTIDASGNPWLVFGSFWSGIKLVTLDRTTMKPSGSLVGIAQRSAGIEAPTIIFHSGFYYLFASIDKCCMGVNSTYKIVYSRSRAITGPYLDKSGKRMLDGGGTVLDAGNVMWKGPGGQDISDGVIARHAYDASDGGKAKLLINDLRWTTDGWPTY